MLKHGQKIFMGSHAEYIKHIYMARYLLSSQIAGFNQGNLAVQHNYIK
jgi:hypothetical protein